jgi:hypothetical protein
MGWFSRPEMEFLDIKVDFKENHSSLVLKILTKKSANQENLNLFMKVVLET